MNRDATLTAGRMAAPRLQGDSGSHPLTKHPAIEDARNTQKLVDESWSTTGNDSPPYILSELIGKGSFGRVYKALTKTVPPQVVAIKIISIDDGDSFDPGTSDTLRDVLHEINTLKLLAEGGAKNVNIIIDTLLVGPTIWLITEHCAGGSVSTLMKPTNGLPEKWIIPILRETAVAIQWIHKHSIIHRDIKCANILITEDGHVQLCDFGVAGIINSRFDKRSTVTGTLQWMAPEFFDSKVSYGIEVDIWAFGSTAYEMAVGKPPNATSIVNVASFGRYLKSDPPHLQSEQFSPELRDLISRCMVPDPEARPLIEHVQQHPYISNTEFHFPTSSLQTLVHDYRIWESRGGDRLSLFSPGGAQAIYEESVPVPEVWDFETMRSSCDGLVNNDSMSLTELSPGSFQVPISRRRRMPANIKPLVLPLERVFNPNTMSNYDDNARAFYVCYSPSLQPDITPRADEKTPGVRESLIDLDAANDQTFRVDSNSHPAQERPLTRDWRFPSTSELRPEASHTSNIAEERPTIKPVPPRALQQGRPLTSHWKFPVMATTMGRAHLLTTEAPKLLSQTLGHESMLPASVASRASALSLIDLDASFFDQASEETGHSRPSTATSDSVSVSSMTSYNPFPYEQQRLRRSTREPSIYVADDIGVRSEPLTIGPEGEEQTTLPGKPRKGTSEIDLEMLAPSRSGNTDNPDGFEYINLLRSHAIPQIASWPTIPYPPSASVLLASASTDEMKEELLRMVCSLKDYLFLASDFMNALPAKRKI